LVDIKTEPRAQRCKKGDDKNEVWPKENESTKKKVTVQGTVRARRKVKRELKMEGMTG